MPFTKPAGFLRVLSLPLVFFGLAGIMVGVAQGIGGYAVGGVVSGVLGILCLYYY